MIRNTVLWFVLYAVLGVVGLIGFSSAMVGLFAEFPVARRAARIALGSGVLVLVLGFGSTVLGLTHSFRAVAYAAPEDKAAILAAAIDASMRSTWIGLGEFIFVLPLATAALLRVAALGKR